MAYTLFWFPDRAIVQFSALPLSVISRANSVLGLTPVALTGNVIAYPEDG